MHGAKVKGSFEGHVSYLGKAIDGGIKITQLAEAKLGSEGFDIGQEDVDAGTLEENTVVLPFKLS